MFLQTASVEPTDPRVAGDGVSSRVSSTAARLARMAATALSIAASSGGGALRVVVVPPRTSPAMPPAGRPPLPAYRYAQPPSRRPTRLTSSTTSNPAPTTAIRQFQAGHAGDQSHSPARTTAPAPSHAPASAVRRSRLPPPRRARLGPHFKGAPTTPATSARSTRAGKGLARVGKRLEVDVGRTRTL